MSINKLDYGKRLKLAFHNLIPQHALTKLLGFFASKNFGFITTFVIKKFIKSYKIDMKDYVLENASDYKTFNDFFIRKLKDGARKFDILNTNLVSPADGVVSQAGIIIEGNLIQAKGHYYSLKDLTYNESVEKDFVGGSFTTIYLSPKDYHCIHVPCDAKLVKTVFIPGNLYSVNNLLVNEVPNLFARNERLICYFETDNGPFIQVLVGATVTGYIYTTWEGIINKDHGNNIIESDFSNDEIFFKAGYQMGAFLLGSTVINIFNNKFILDENIITNKEIKVGEQIAKLI